MSAETFFLNRAARPGLQELDDVVLSAPVTSTEGQPIAAGVEGTVVAVLAPGMAYMVEFPEPEGTLAEVVASKLSRVEHARL